MWDRHLLSCRGEFHITAGEGAASAGSRGRRPLWSQILHAHIQSPPPGGAQGPNQGPDVGRTVLPQLSTQPSEV